MTPDDDAARMKGMLDFCHGLLGEFSVQRDHSWPHGESKVLELRDRAGQRWIAKSSRKQQLFQQEVTAYRSWTPSLGERVPTMLSDDPSSHTIVVSFEAGAVSTVADADAHCQAGALIRRFHDAAPARPAPDFQQELSERLECTIRAAGQQFAKRDVDFVRGQVADLDGVAGLVLVPAHRDNQPRNWLVDDDGVVRLIDFGLSQWDVWVRDLVRLHQSDWQSRPELEEAFLDGYGKSPSADDHQVLRSISAVTAILTVLWASDHGDRDFARLGWRALDLARAQAC